MLKNNKKLVSKPLKTHITKSTYMGRIKQLMVKRASKDLLTKDLHFGEHFTGNKRMLGSNTMPSKKIRNKIAGYISRLRRAEVKAKLAEDIRLANKTTILAETAYS